MIEFNRSIPTVSRTSPMILRRSLSTVASAFSIFTSITNLPSIPRLDSKACFPSRLPVSFYQAPSSHESDLLANIRRQQFGSSCNNIQTFHILHLFLMRYHDDKRGTVQDGGSKVQIRDGTGPLTNSKHINPHIPAPARASICYGRNGVSPFPSLSIGQKCICLTHISLFLHEGQLHEREESVDGSRPSGI